MSGLDRNSLQQYDRIDSPDSLLFQRGPIIASRMAYTAICATCRRARCAAHAGPAKRPAAYGPTRLEREPRVGARLQAAVVRKAERTCRPAPGERRAHGACRRLQRHADRHRCVRARALGRRRTVSAGGAESLSSTVRSDRLCRRGTNGLQTLGMPRTASSIAAVSSINNMGRRAQFTEI